jgi:hypothetical protein
LSDYASDKLDHLSYALIGTFGAGKTQLLFHVFKKAKNSGLLPLYCLAEDIFREVITKDQTVTPGDLYLLVEEKVKNIKTAVSEKDEKKIKKILDPRGKIANDFPELIRTVTEPPSNLDLKNLKIVLLVDELEGQYGVLQDRVETRDRSPLRGWLESMNYLKFLAFAPAGIYALGGADRDRVKRIVLPPADIDYIRENLISNPGRSNAAWWLSRGKARQLFKCYEVFNDIKPNMVDAAYARRVVMQELDWIGQDPTQVPPAAINEISPMKTPYLLNLRPIEGEKLKQYVIDTSLLDTGELASRLVEAFGISKNNAILISEYFQRTVKALSDENSVTYVRDKDLPELFCLVFDHMLEYEHGSPGLSGTMGQILSLYERVQSEHPALYGTIARMWEHKDSVHQLPLGMREIRRSFPFPTMNPIVKNHLPSEMKTRWEGKGLPIWKYLEGNATVLFFGSERDFMSYSEKDEFLSLVLPEQKGVICLFPSGELLKEKGVLILWLEKNFKATFMDVSPLLTDFLFSASGEIVDGEVPGDLRLVLESLMESKEDILLSRKARIYGEAIDNVLETGRIFPRIFFRENEQMVKDGQSVWGSPHIGNKQVSIPGVALAFADLTRREKELLAGLRELLRGGKEGRGVGDLHSFIPSTGGYSTLPDDLLPRYRRRELRHSDPVSRIRAYWREDERKELAELARTLSLWDFLKLHSEENMLRLLEAFWRVTRGEFDYLALDNLIHTLEVGVLPLLRESIELEKKGRETFKLQGVNFGGYETLAKAVDGFQRLLGIAKECVNPEKKTHVLVECIASILIQSLDIETDAREFGGSCQEVMRHFGNLETVANDLRKNCYEYSKATKFLGMKDKDIEELISKQLEIGGTPTLQNLQNEVNERKGYLEEINNSLGILEGKLSSLEEIFATMTKGETENE